MKKLTLLLFLLSCLVVSGIHAQTIPYGTPTLDGSIGGESEWKSAGRVRMARFYGSDQFADFWLLWDANYLYVAGKLEDYTLLEDGGGTGSAWETWQDDSVEIYVHPTVQPTTTLNKFSRVFAFTPTGKFQRLDRGSETASVTTSLEMPGNTNAVIGNDFLNTAKWNWVCADKQAAPTTEKPIVRYAPSLQGSLNNSADRDIGWNFELAIPWSLLGTAEGTKVTGDNCGLGTGISPTTLTPADGLNLQLNFYRIGDDDGGAVKPRDPFPNTYFKLSELAKSDPAQRKADSSGVLLDEWFVYQGDRFNPSEWATFTLTGARHTADSAPHFTNLTVTATPLDGRRATLQLSAPKRDTTGGAANRYQIRYQVGVIPVDENSWATMQVFDNAYIPATPGSSQKLPIIGLQPGQTYTIAVRATDEGGRVTPEILTTTVTLPNSADNFVTVAPTGRSLVFSDATTPFLVLGETGLMPWLPLRGLYGQNIGDLTKDPNAQPSATEPYNGFLCDENYPVAPEASEKCGEGQLEAGKHGRWRNYYINKNKFPNEGEQVAVDYFAKLKASGVNVLTVFVESLDLDITPIFFELSSGNYNPYVLTFLDHLVELARQNDVYLVLRLYDTYYYKDDFYANGDSNGRNKGRKWSDTSWAKLGKPSPDNFFDEDVYSRHLQRMQTLFYWVNKRTGVAYKDEPHILGWDIVNEVDNRERFNTASYSARKKWLEYMLSGAKESAPKQLVFYSFLTWDPKDAAYYRASIGQNVDGEVITETKYLGMDAYLAYRAPNSSIAAPHGYYAHIANPTQTPPTPDYVHPLELARGITYGFYQIRDGRPILDMEGAPNPLYIKNYNAKFTQENDKEMFLNSAWLHFVSGGAGANLRWPIDLTHENSSFNQIPAEWRDLLKIFKENVGNILWRGDKLQIDHQKISEVLTTVRHDGSYAVAYAFNPYKTALTSIGLPSLAGQKGSVRALIPSTGEVLYDYTAIGDLGTIPLPRAVNEAVAVVIRGMGNLGGSNPSNPSNPSPIPDATARLKGISTRGYVANVAENNMFAGIIIAGSGSQKLLVRGLGQGLATAFGVATDLDARLEIKDINGNSVVDSNDNWQAHISATQLPQFAATPPSVLDAALLTPLNTGTYSIQVSPVNASGVGLVEVFDKDLSTSNKLTGISTRGYVGNTPAEFLYAGISVQGNLKVLIRGLGEGLQNRGVAGALDDAKIVVRKGADIIATNDSWNQDSSATELQQKQQSPPATSDAAMFITLSEGDYTIEVSSARGGKGVALVEVYDMP